MYSYIHPGPIKYPCGLCSKNVVCNAKAIQGDGCEYLWYHSKCANIDPHYFSLLQRTSLSCICTKCGTPNISFHHSIDLG